MNPWFLIFAGGCIGLAVMCIAWFIDRALRNERKHNPNPDNLPPDSRVSEDEPRIWGADLNDRKDDK